MKSLQNSQKQTCVCVCIYVQIVAVVHRGGFSNTLGWMAVFGNRQKLDCLPLLTLGEMFQEKMVHQSEVLWALGSKAEKWGRGDCASSHFHCCMTGTLPLPSQKSFVYTKWTFPWKLKFQSRTGMRGLCYGFFLYSPPGFVLDRIRAAMQT